MNKAKHYRGGYDVAGLSGLARQLRKQQTRSEGLLWQLLRNRQLLGFKFRRQHQFGDYVADFYCHEGRLVVECDGLVHQSQLSSQSRRRRHLQCLLLLLCGKTKCCDQRQTLPLGPLPKGKGRIGAQI